MPQERASTRTTLHDSSAPIASAARTYLSWLLALAVLFGFVVRAAQYAADRSFWHDEASLVLNIRNKTAAQLLGRLDFNQAAPPLFLLAEHGVFRELGGSEYALRLLPLACGLASVLIFALLARRVLPSPWDALAAALFALSDLLVWHAAEAKPYGVDVFFATLLLWLAIGTRPGISEARRLARVAVAAVVGVLMSYTAVLVFAGISLALAPAFVRRGLRGIGAYVPCNLPVAITFGAVLYLSVRAQRNGALNEYWRQAFVDWHRPWTLPWWLLRQLQSLCNYFDPLAGPIVLAGMAAGIWSLAAGARTGSGRSLREAASSAHESQPRGSHKPAELLLLLTAPILVAIAAAAAHRYPFDGARLSVFLAPCVLLLAAFGFRWIWLALVPGIGVFALTPAAYALGVACFWSGLHLIHPRTRADLRPIASYLRTHASSSDGIYSLEQREFECYWPPGDPRVRWEMDRADRIPFKRFWLVWSFANQKARHRRDPLLAWIRQFAKQEDEVTSAGGAAVLFERIGKKEPSPLDPPATGTHHRMLDRDGSAQEQE